MGPSQSHDQIKGNSQGQNQGPSQGHGQSQGKSSDMAKLGVRVRVIFGVEVRVRVIDLAQNQSQNLTS